MFQILSSIAVETIKMVGPCTLFAFYIQYQKKEKQKKVSNQTLLKGCHQGQNVTFSAIDFATVSRIHKIFLLAQPNKVALDQYFSVFLLLASPHFKEKCIFQNPKRKMRFPAICRSKGQKFLLQKA